MTNGNRQPKQPGTLWAQLVELEDRTNVDQLAKAHLVADICDTEQLGVRDFARRARTVYGLDALGAPSLVSRLLSWAELVTEAHENGVLPAGNTPAEWTLRPLFAKHVPADVRLELLAKAVVDGHVTAKAVRAAVAADCPKPKKRPIPRGKVNTRAAIPKLRGLIDTYGYTSVERALARLANDYIEIDDTEPVRVIRSKQSRPTKEDIK